MIRDGYKIKLVYPIYGDCLIMQWQYRSNSDIFIDL